MRRLALFIAILVLPASAAAEPKACSKRTEVISHLAKKFKEAPAALGLASNGGLVEVLTNGNGSTWTIILTMPNGISCLVATGEDWQNLAKLAIDEPAI